MLRYELTTKMGLYLFSSYRCGRNLGLFLQTNPLFFYRDGARVNANGWETGKKLVQLMHALRKSTSKEFPGGPVVVTPGLLMPRGLGSIPGQETKIPQVKQQQTKKTASNENPNKENKEWLYKENLQQVKTYLLLHNSDLRRRQWHPTPVLLPGKSMDGGAWEAAVHGVTKSQTWLSDFTFTFYFHALEKEMATHSSVLAWRIPGTEEPDGLPSMGSHRVGHDWSDSAAAAAIVIWFSKIWFTYYFSGTQ